MITHLRSSNLIKTSIIENNFLVVIELRQITVFREDLANFRAGSLSWFELEFGDVGFCGERITRELGEKRATPDLNSTHIGGR